ncbi:MAG: hypothetical protein ACKPKO_19280, partial [Candidatus Fonsibacter sp.]
APPFDGRFSWFAYEEAVDDWLDITTLPPAAQGTKRESNTGRRCQHLHTLVGVSQYLSFQAW